MGIQSNNNDKKCVCLNMKDPKMLFFCQNKLLKISVFCMKIDLLKILSGIVPPSTKWCSVGFCFEYWAVASKTFSFGELWQFFFNFCLLVLTNSRKNIYYIILSWHATMWPSWWQMFVIKSVNKQATILATLISIPELV